MYTGREGFVSGKKTRVADGRLVSVGIDVIVRNIVDVGNSNTAIWFVEYGSLVFSIAYVGKSME